MDKNLSELIGIIGDGNLSNPQKHYRIGFTGDPVNDKRYFEYIKDLIKKTWNKDARIFHARRGIRIVVNSKPAFVELTQTYHLPIGEGKSERVVIPEIIAKDWNSAKHTIRGIVDTDGSIFVADKPRSPNYPSIEISTNSIRLARQLKMILSTQGFRVANIWSYQSKKSSFPSFKVPLNGRENVRRWLRYIGFSNPTKRKKAEKAIAQPRAFQTFQCPAAFRHGILRHTHC
jgi:hypothetical protein